MTETTSAPAFEVPGLNESDPEMMKGFNRQFITGVTVVTTKDGDKPRGLVVNAYSSISLDPPLIMVCVQRTTCV